MHSSQRLQVDSLIPWLLGPKSISPPPKNKEIGNPKKAGMSEISTSSPYEKKFL